MRRRRYGQLGRVGSSASILLALMSYVSSGVANAQAPAGAPPAAPPGPPPSAEPAPMAPPPAETAPPPPVYTPVTPAIGMAPPVPPPATGPIPSVSGLKIVIPNATIRLGIFLQPQFESAQIPTATGYANNLYLRRARFVAGGTIFDNVEWFLETDSPNLFKGATGPGTGAALKTTSTMLIQDLFGTYRVLGDMLKIDAGYTLPAASHNALQSAFTLFGWDYFAYTFQNTNSFGAATPPVGRDLGVQVRGLVVDGHIEYRVGLWQGQRNAAVGTAGPPAVIVDQSARNFFRTAARLQINIFDPETGYFYGGTYLGAKKILSLGASYDFQSDYKAYAADAFLDMPLGPGIVTAQVDYSHWDGGTYLPLPKQWALQGEAGYTFLPIAVAPIVRVEHLHVDPTDSTQNRYAGGLAYWCYGHNSNLKLFYTRIQQDGAPHGANQINLQWQIFIY
jgi:hypothetical protein